jgi:hypothetical protein
VVVRFKEQHPVETDQGTRDGQTQQLARRQMSEDILSAQLQKEQ